MHLSFRWGFWIFVSVGSLGMILAASPIVSLKLRHSTPKTTFLVAPPPLPQAPYDGGAPPTSPDDWARPRVLRCFATGCARSVWQRELMPKCKLNLYVVTQGLSHPHYFALIVPFCLVGKDIFPVIENYNGVYLCQPTRELREGELVTVVVNWSKAASDIQRGVFELIDGKILIGASGDLEPLNQRINGTSRPLVVRSNVTWTGQIDRQLKRVDQEGRYEVCMMTQEKIWGADLEQWVDYHRRIGVDMVYIYDNGVSDENLKRVFGRREDVELVPWPHTKSQLLAHAHMLILGKRRCEWILLNDVDEWVFFAKGKMSGVESAENPGRRAPPLLDSRGAMTLKQHVNRWSRRGYDAICLGEVAMGNSGHHYRPNSSIPEAYVHLGNGPQNRLAICSKQIVRGDAATPVSAVHYIHMQVGAETHALSKNATGGSETTKIVLQPEEGYIFHFNKRSWEDYVRKVRGGRNGLTVVDWAHRRNVSSYNIDQPGGQFISRGLPYTEFRDHWRRVMQEHPKYPPRQVLLRRDGRLRCYRGALRNQCQNI